MRQVLGEVAVGLRRQNGLIEERRWSPQLHADGFRAVERWRTFRWWHDQTHYWGTFWSSTMRGHVIHEPRLELARLLYAE